MEGRGDDSNDEGDIFNPEEEVGIASTAKSDLPVVEIITGEEDEELIFKIRAKLFRWRDEWKERGVGELKLLRHKNTKRIRCVLRQDKTLKPVANFLVSSDDPFCLLKEHQGSDKMFFFTAYDCSEEPLMEKFVLKFGNAENATKFKTAFNDARDFNKALKTGGELKYAAVINEKDEEDVKEVKKEEEKKEETKPEEKSSDK
jgi:hypothetical protein